MIKDNIRRIYRSREDRVVSGVCGGVGEYFNLDPVLIRVLWLSAFLAYGAGIVMYILAALIIPEEH